MHQVQIFNYFDGCISKAMLAFLEPELDDISTVQPIFY
jgi:hypothetical protein